MAWDDVPPKLAGGRPAPVYWDEELQDWVAPHGRRGHAGQILYGPDGEPVSVVDGKLRVRAAELETAIANLQAALLDNQSTAAKQDALAGLVGAIDAAAVSDPAAAGAVIALLKGVLERLQTVEGKIDGITDGTAPAKTELTGSIATTVTEGKLAVRAAELEAKIEAVRVLLNALAGKDFATQTTLAQILGKMIAAPATEAKQDSLATLVGAIEGKLDGVIDGTTPAKTELTGSNVQDSEALPVKQMPSTVTEDVINKQADIYSSINILIEQNVPPEIYGAKWNKGEIPTLTRTDAAVEKVANVGVDFEPASNDFDSLPIWGEIEEASDEYGNIFVRIPKFYIRKMDGEGYKSWQVSKRRYPGFYLPWCFWNFTKKQELPYFDFGSHLATLGENNRLQSKPGLYPLINTNIINMRNYAKNNNNDDDGLTGYQQLDIHAIDVLQTLMFIEFATLNIQSVMQGYTTGQYTATHLATVTETATNRIIVATAHANLYRVGQSISVGTTQGGNQRFYGRTITAIEDYDANNKAIVFDGSPVDITKGDMLYNTAWKTGFSREIVASSGSIGANDGKYPCVYRGIESPFGDMYQFVDGVNITDRQAWVCENADQYASNFFAHPYESLSYRNYADITEGYVKEMGFDPQHPYAGFPTAVGGSSTTYYSDYHYNSTGERIARFGGCWIIGGNVGPSYWNLNNAASAAELYIGGRLLKKAS